MLELAEVINEDEPEGQLSNRTQKLEWKQGSDKHTVLNETELGSMIKSYL